MRAVEIVRTHQKPTYILRDYAELLVDRFGCSRATAFRAARLATDVLGIVVSTDEGRRTERRLDGQANARMLGWTNGKPGRRAA